MKNKICCYIGLGSNLNNPIQQIKTALRSAQNIPNTQVIKISDLYKNKAYGPIEQPAFINAVMELHTTLSAIELLNELQAIEHTQGRVRTLRWGPRTLDLDLLLYGNEIIVTEKLIVPHPEISKRNFVLYPLANIAPELIFPSGENITNLLSQCEIDDLEKI